MIIEKMDKEIDVKPRRGGMLKTARISLLRSFNLSMLAIIIIAPLSVRSGGLQG